MTPDVGARAFCLSDRVRGAGAPPSTRCARGRTPAMRLRLACLVVSSSAALLAGSVAACGSSSSGDSATQHTSDGGSDVDAASGCGASKIKKGTFDLTY